MTVTDASPQRPSFSISPAFLAPRNKQPPANPCTNSQPPPSPHSVCSSGAVSSLRTLRSLLPFGPAKQSQQSSPNVTGGSFKGALASFGSVRRSMTGERKPPASRTSSSEKDLPVLTIYPEYDISRANSRSGTDVASTVDDADAVGDVGTVDGKGTDAPRSSAHGHNSSMRSLPPLPVPLSGPPLSTDLSIITEADSSDFSCITSTQAQTQPHTLTPTRLEALKPKYGYHSKATQSNQSIQRYRTLPDPPTSVGDSNATLVDLQTSRAGLEGLDLVDQNEQGAVVPVSLKPDRRPQPSTVPRARSSFGFNKGNHLDVFSLRLPNSTPPSRTSPVETEEPTVTSRPNAAPEQEEDISPFAASRDPVAQSSPKRPPPQSRWALNPPSSLPRLMRPKDTPAPLLLQKCTTGSSPVRADRAKSPPLNQRRRRASLENLLLGRSQTPSPLLLSQTHQSNFEPPCRNTLYSHRLPPSIRTAATPTPPRALATSFDNGSDVDSNSPGTCPCSSQRAPSRSRLPRPTRSSIDCGTRPDIAERDRAFLTRTRKRSMSVEAPRVSPGPAPSRFLSSIARPSTSLSNNCSGADGRSHVELLGPRTMKTFAAAGLLGREHGQTSKGCCHHSHAGAMRNNADYDFELRTPARAPHSDVFESTLENRRFNLHSRSTAASDASCRLMENHNTPRTTLSNLSPSVSTVSSSQQSIHATLLAMKEKHDTATEALLSALADSQRTVKLLREENTRLQQLIHDLQIQNMPITPDSDFSQPYARSRYIAQPMTAGRSRVLALEHPHRQSRSHSSTPLPTRRSERNHLSNDKEDPFPLDNEGQRLSPSSIVAALPSDMSMLMRDEVFSTDHSHKRSRGNSPLSPSLQSLPQDSGFAQLYSLPPKGDVSPVTANFTMTEVSNSPSSLLLRPEHEIHLEDMSHLDLTQYATDESYREM